MLYGINFLFLWAIHERIMFLLYLTIDYYIYEILEGTVQNFTILPPLTPVEVMKSPSFQIH